jgi:hypothetical protein
LKRHDYSIDVLWFWWNSGKNSSISCQFLSLKCDYWKYKIRQRKNWSIRKKTGAQNIVKEIKQYQQKWLQHALYRGWTKTDYQDKHCITDQTDKGT